MGHGAGDSNLCLYMDRATAELLARGPHVRAAQWGSGRRSPSAAVLLLYSGGILKTDEIIELTHD